MGRKSIKENKNIYQLKREEVGLTRETASEKIHCSEDTIKRIELNNQLPTPDMVLSMAEVYREPALCNKYCTTQCPIGSKILPKVTERSLSGIVLEMSTVMNKMPEKMEHLSKIAIDDKVDKEELRKFYEIQKDFDKLSSLMVNFRFWFEEMIAEGNIDREEYNWIIKTDNK